MLTLKDLGELSLIKKISKQFSSLVQGQVTGIGDDCAIIPSDNEFDKDRVTLVTTDLFIEGTHFLKNKMAAKDVGYKALAVNISDIAAMGGRAKSAFLSLGLPVATEIK